MDIHSLAIVFANKGRGFLIILGAVAVIVFFDKIVRLVIYVVDKVKERRRKKL